MNLTKEDFESCIDAKISLMQSDYIDLTSGDIHREIGDYPDSTNHRMPVCCDVMYSKMSGDDTVLSAPPKGKGATLTIRYYKRNH